MDPSVKFLIGFGVFSVLCGVNYAIPLPAEEVDQQQPPSLPKNLPFSLDLQPPLPDNTGGSNKAVVLPLRDSYGNPIPPAVLGVDPSGVDYGSNTPTGNTISIKKTINTQGINFPIPSYASGITEIHRPSNGLLPPFDNNRKPVQDPLAPATTNTDLLHPATDLLPPISSTQIKDDTINEISGKALQERFGTNFNSQQLPNIVNNLQPAQRGKATSFPAQSGGENNPFLGSSAVSTVSAVPALPVIPSVTAISVPLVPSSPAVPPLVITNNQPSTSAKDIKYTGGFGGAPGVLGEQILVGYGVKPESNIAAAPAASTIASPPPSPPLTVAVAPVPIAAAVAVAEETSSTGVKYTGGFGGPPGVLLPYDNVKQ